MSEQVDTQYLLATYPVRMHTVLPQSHDTLVKAHYAAQLAAAAACTLKAGSASTTHEFAAASYTSLVGKARAGKPNSAGTLPCTTLFHNS
jgi:hypothetical protein